MSCKHERIKSENCVLTCMICGAVLPADFFTKQSGKPKADAKPDNSPAEIVTGVESTENAVSGDGVPVLCEGVPTIPDAEPAENAPKVAFDDCPNEAVQDAPAEEKKKPGRPAKK